MCNLLIVPNRNFSFCLIILLFSNFFSAQSLYENRPNILFFITDDQSWVNTSFSGEVAISTPGFDKIANEGIFFENAICASPSCSPSRGAIITGQEIWRLGEASQLFSAVPKELSKLCFPLLLESSGYNIGYTQKGWAPNDFDVYGWDSYPLGKSYSQKQVKPLTNQIVKNDYFNNFKVFLNDNNGKKPFFFWCGTSEPHRAYQKGSGKINGIDLKNINVPGFLPDELVIREDISDYLLEIKWTDQHLEKIINLLEKKGILDNTIIIVTSDNGMAFPGAKATLYEYGIHVPLAIRWGNGIKSAGRSSDVLVSLTDLAPTILEVAKVEIPTEMTGKSLNDIFLGLKIKDRSYVFSGKERHTVCREGDLPYPQRAIRDSSFLYIQNFEPDRWPAGSPYIKSSHGWEYGDIDLSPTFNFMQNNTDNVNVKRLLDFATEKRPHEELFDITNDPYCQNNLIDNVIYESHKIRLSEALNTYLVKTKDPRLINENPPWDSYPYYFKNPKGIIPYHNSRNE